MAPASPVLSIEEPIRFVDGVFWNMPMPPRSTALGTLAAPANPAICEALPYVHENPTRGLR